MEEWVGDTLTSEYPVFCSVHTQTSLMETVFLFELAVKHSYFCLICPSGGGFGGGMGSGGMGPMGSGLGTGTPTDGLNVYFNHCFSLIIQVKRLDT